MTGGPGLQEEQSPLRDGIVDDEMWDMVNLATRRTGLAGTIHISTRRASHGPRVNWYPGRAAEDAPCLIVTLETPPRPINMGLPARVARDGEAVAVPWAARNRDALLRFWHHGLSWDSDEVQAFIDGLARLP